jgi:acyl carrier protein phosphodiesterase
MPVDLDRMLESCQRDQWSVGDLDWTRKPREMSREDEMKIVQLFTDMAGIERLAGALFREQERRVTDPTLKAIFRSFVVDEVRHSHAAQMLADFYDVHHYKLYRQSESLTDFAPHFVDAIHYLSDDVANAYIVAGELILDIALLRSINDFVHDDMSQEAMTLINRDESRHIAIDYHMAEYYGSEAYERRMAERATKLSLAERARGAKAFVYMLHYGHPFIRDVFLDPMNFVDPQGRRLRDAFKRMQLLGRKEETSRRPFTRFLRVLQDGVDHPIAGRLLGDVLGRVGGVGKDFMARQYDDKELSRVRRMSYEEMAKEALSVKEN